MQQLRLPLRFEDAVSPYERDVVARRLRELNRSCGPVPSMSVAAHLGIPDRTARHYLARLEKAGYVRRPAGVRSGWAVAV